MNQENKPKAVWTKVQDLEQGFSISVSNGGAVKIEHEDRIVSMFPGSQLESLHLVLTSLNPEQIQAIQAQAVKNKEFKRESTRVEKEMARVTARAAASIQALADIAKAKGLSPEAYLATLFKAS